jgi:hypothetical protein
MNGMLEEWNPEMLEHWSTGVLGKKENDNKEQHHSAFFCFPFFQFFITPSLHYSTILFL